MVAHDTVESALVDVVARVCAITACTVRYGGCQITAFALSQGGRFVHGVNGAYEQRMWAEARDFERVRARREFRLEDAIDRLRLNPATVDETISTPCPPEQTAMVRFHAALPLWWQARLLEGHTAESARMMLGLLVDPDNWRHLAFAEDGRPVPGPDYRHPFV